MPRHAHRSTGPLGRRVAPVAGGLLAVALAVPVVVAGVVSADGDAGRPAKALGEQAAASVRLPDHSRQLDPVLDQPRVALAELRAEAKAERLAELRAQREAARRAAERKARIAAERQAAREERQAERAAATAPFDFKIGSFNVLGSQHTAPGGDRQKFPPASVRTPAAANLVAKHGVDVLGTQELQADQLRGLQARTGMSAYPGFGWGEAETDNSVLWDPGMFELVSGSRFTINFMGRPRPQPIVRLRHLATGRELYVVNTHPSAGRGSTPRSAATGRVSSSGSSTT